MSRDRSWIDREGIHIDRELADQIAIEEELDANIEGQYRFPPPARRRISGWVFLAVGAVSLLAFDGGWIPAVGLVILAGWQFLSSWPLNVDEHEALTTAAAGVDFPIGHAAATVRFHGWRSRPRWSVMLYSATEPPDRRGLVVVDAVDGSIVETPYVEDIGPV